MGHLKLEAFVLKPSKEINNETDFNGRIITKKGDVAKNFNQYLIVCIQFCQQFLIL